MNAAKPSGASDEGDTGLPGFRTWGSVYASVSILFLVWLGLLIVLTRFYS